MKTIQALFGLLLLAASLATVSARADQPSGCLTAFQPPSFQVLNAYSIAWLRTLPDGSPYRPVLIPVVLEDIKIGQLTETKRLRVHTIDGLPKDFDVKPGPSPRTDPSPIYIVELGKRSEDEHAPVTAKGGRHGDQASGHINIKDVVDIKGDLVVAPVQIISVGGTVRVATLDFSDKTISVSPVTQADVSHASGGAGSATSMRSAGGLSIDLPPSKEHKIRGRVTLVVGPEVYSKVHGPAVAPSASGAVEFIFF